MADTPPDPTPDAQRERVWKFQRETSENCLKAVVKAQRAGKAPYWSKITAEVVGEEVKLKCHHCSKHFASSNMARWAKDHFKNDYSSCVGVLGKRPADGGSSDSKRSKVSDNTGMFGAPESRATAAVEHLIMCIFTNLNASFSLVECPHLKQAFAELGVSTLPSRKQLSTTHLDRVYEQCVRGGLGRRDCMMLGREQSQLFSHAS
jgi:hypothetical protein